MCCVRMMCPIGYNQTHHAALRQGRFDGRERHSSSVRLGPALGEGYQRAVCRYRRAVCRGSRASLRGLRDGLDGVENVFWRRFNFQGCLDGWLSSLPHLFVRLRHGILGKGISPFTTKTHRRFLVCAILLWVYALVDFVWLPLLEQVGTLMQMQEFSFSVVEHGLDMGLNFNIGAVFAAAVLTLIASLVHYASLLQQQADELF